jgi:hypothetical protein
VDTLKESDRLITKASIYFPVTGCTTAWAKYFFFQSLVRNAITLLAVSMFQKSSSDKFLGERFFIRAGNLGDAGWPSIGVTTLGNNGVLSAVFALLDLCDRI